MTKSTAVASGTDGTAPDRQPSIMEQSPPTQRLPPHSSSGVADRATYRSGWRSKASRRNRFRRKGAALWRRLQDASGEASQLPKALLCAFRCYLGSSRSLCQPRATTHSGAWVRDASPADASDRGEFSPLSVSLDPELLVLDEPTVALDVEARRDFWATMRSFAARGKTVLRHPLPGGGRRLRRPSTRRLPPASVDTKR